MPGILGGTLGRAGSQSARLFAIPKGHLRKSARLFVALFDLVDLNLGARGGGAGLTNGTIILERFRLDLSREEAVQYMQGIIQESLGALFPQVVDVVHRWRLFFKT